MLKHNRNQSLIARAIDSSKSLTALLLVAGSISLLSTGCVDSSSEIELFAPVAVECVVDGGGIQLKTGGSSSSSSSVTTLTTFNISPGDQQPYTIDPATGTPVYVDSGMTMVGIVMRSGLKATNSYTTIGANGELRINQNIFEAKKVTYEITESGGLGDGLKLAPKEITDFVPTGGSVTSLIPLIDPTLPEDKAFVAAVGNKKTVIKVRMQIEGNLRGGQSLKTSTVYLTIQTNAEKYSTFACAKISKS